MKRFKDIRKGTNREIPVKVDYPADVDAQFTGKVPPFEIQPDNQEPQEGIREDRNEYKSYKVEFNVPGTGSGESGCIECVARTQDEAVRKARGSYMKESGFGESTFMTVKSVTEQTDDDVNINEEFITEEDVLSVLKNISKKKSEMTVNFDNGKTLEVDPKTASLLLNLFDALKGANKVKFTKNLSKGPNSFLKIVDFASETVGA